jgi:quercetin dioxygenase-like cupin family protein
VLIAPIDDSPLSLEDVRLGAGEMLALAEAEQDSLLYVYAGGALLNLSSDSRRLEAGTAALVLAGEDATVTSDDSGIALVHGRVNRTADRHAPLGDREIVTRLDGAGSDLATGARSFEVLFGPRNGSAHATLFVGFVPPGKASWHFHLYDEIVWIPEGPGRLHLEDGVDELERGSAFRLRPRQVHIVENTGSSTLEVLGFFTPAGSPAAAYLP